MSIKKLFEKNKQTTTVNKYLKKSAAGNLGDGIESAAHLSESIKKNNDFISPVDYSNPDNFVKFGSAEKYYAAAFDYISSSYPYDGSGLEITKFYNDLNPLEKWVFNDTYPKSTGYITLGRSYGTPTSHSSGYYSSSVEYVQTKGGPHSGTLYSIPEYRTNNLEFGGVSGSSVEFALKKDWTVSQVTSSREVVMDVWNGNLSSSHDYGRFTISLRSEQQDRFFVTMQSGTTGFYELPVPTTGGINIGNNDWSQYSFTFDTSGSTVDIKFYQTGTCVGPKISYVAGIGVVTGSLISNLGGLRSAPSGTAAATDASMLGWGKLSGSLDEFRFWKRSRTSEDVGRYWFTRVYGGTDKYLANVDLGVYYRFNEGVTDSTSLDQVVLDYSGRISNGLFVNYASGARNTGSAVDSISLSASLGIYEPPDPIVRPTHHMLTGSRGELTASGKLYDYTNTARIVNMLPSWIVDQDENNNQELSNLTQIMASYLDTLYSQISELSQLKQMRYISGSATGSINEFPYNDRLLDSMGIQTPEIFENAGVLERFFQRGESVNYEQSITEIKNVIYKNIYANLPYILKSKGNEKSIRNFIRCLGVGEDIISLNVYANNQDFDLDSSYKAGSSAKKYVDFSGLLNEQDSYGSVYQYYNQENPDSIGIITGSNDLAQYAFTVESEFIFPNKSQANTLSHDLVTVNSASLFGFHSPLTASVTSSNLTWADYGNDHGLMVFAIKSASADAEITAPMNEIKDVSFAVMDRAGTIILTSSVFQNVYENQKWNLALSVRPSKYPYSDGVLGAVIEDQSSDYYKLEFYGVNYDTGYKRNYFYLTSSISAASGSSIICSSKRLYMGSHRTNFTGAVDIPTDVRASSLVYWTDYIPTGTVDSHSQDVDSFGRRRPYRYAYGFQTGSDQVYIPQAETMALNWDFANVTGSNANGRFLVSDFSSGSATGSSAYLANYQGMPFSSINLRQHTGRGDFFATSSSPVQKQYVYTQKLQLPEYVASDDMVKILDGDVAVFQPNRRPVNFYFSLEKSMYQNISNRMLQMFASIEEMNNLIGEPVNKYRPNYKSMDKLREIFFRKVGNTPDLDKYLQYYRWLDTAMGQMIEQLFPASSRHSEDVRTVVESHLLERPKYHYHFLGNKKRMGNYPYPIGDGVIRASRFSNNPETRGWEQNHAPIPLSQETNGFWWKVRALRTTPPLSQSAFGVNNSRSRILDAVQSEYTSSQTPYIKVSLGANDEENIIAQQRQSRPSNNTGFTFDSFEPLPTPIQQILPNTKRSVPFRATKDGINYKGKLLAPFQAVSSSITTGYQAALNIYGLYNVDLADLHEQPSAMQGPFTYAHVGGLQARRNNPMGQNSNLRKESYKISISSGTGSVQTIISGTTPKGFYRRGLVAEAPVNIRNIQSLTGTISPTNGVQPLGNYTKTYEVVQTNDRSLTNIDFATNTSDYYLVTNIVGGTGSSGSMASAHLTSPTARAFGLTGTVDYYSPRQSSTARTNQVVFVNRFDAPGGKLTSKQQFRDMPSDQISPNNALPYRNTEVRRIGNSAERATGYSLGAGAGYSGFLRQWTSWGGFQQDITPSIEFMNAQTLGEGLEWFNKGLPSFLRGLRTTGAPNITNLSATALSFPTTPVFGLANLHKTQRNTINRPKLATAVFGGITSEYYATASIRDNGFVTRPIPAADRTQWFMSLSGSDTVGRENYFQYYVSSSHYPDDITIPSSTLTAKEVAKFGYFSAAESPSWDIDALLSGTFSPFLSGSNNNVGWIWAKPFPNVVPWTQLRSSELAQVRYYKENNIYEFNAQASNISNTSRAFLENSTRTFRDQGVSDYDAPIAQGNLLTKRYSAQYVEPPITSRYKPLQHVIRSYRGTAAKTEYNQTVAVELKYTYGNMLQGFANKQINVKLGNKRKFQSGLIKRPYEVLRDAYNTGEQRTTTGVDLIKRMTYEETIYPKEIFTYLSGTRARQQFVAPYWKEDQTYIGYNKNATWVDWNVPYGALYSLESRQAKRVQVLTSSVGLEVFSRQRGRLSGSLGISATSQGYQLRSEEQNPWQRTYTLSTRASANGDTRGVIFNNLQSIVGQGTGSVWPMDSHPYSQWLNYTDDGRRPFGDGGYDFFIYNGSIGYRTVRATSFFVPEVAGNTSYNTGHGYNGMVDGTWMAAPSQMAAGELMMTSYGNFVMAQSESSTSPGLFAAGPTYYQTSSIVSAQYLYSVPTHVCVTASDGSSPAYDRYDIAAPGTVGGVFSRPDWTAGIARRVVEGPLRFQPTKEGQPFVANYDEFVENIRRVAPDYTIIPEFRISEQMPFYQEFGSVYVGLSGSLNITGAAYPSGTGDDNFFTRYTNTDIMEYLSPFMGHGTADLEFNKKPKEFSLKSEAIIKFLPYEGFYPQNRSLEIATLFSQSYGEFAIFTGSVRGPTSWTTAGARAGLAANSFTREINYGHSHLSASAWRTLLRPFFAPGILYNSIKSGMAVEYPVTRDGRNDGQFYPGNNSTYDFSTLYSPLRGCLSGGLGGSTLGIPGNRRRRKEGAATQFDFADGNTNKFFFGDVVPFEGLLKPMDHIGMDKPGIRNADINTLMWLDATGTVALSRSLSGNPNPGTPLSASLNDTLYRSAISNFLASTPEFFLAEKDGGHMTKFVAEIPQKNNPDSPQGSQATSQTEQRTVYVNSRNAYMMEIGLRKTDNFNLYSNPYAFGIPTATGSARWEYVESVRGVATTSSQGGVPQGRDWPRHRAQFAPFTPTYYYGPSIARITYMPSVNGEVTLSEILNGNDTYVEYVNEDGHYYDFSSGSFQSATGSTTLTTSRSPIYEWNRAWQNRQDLDATVVIDNKFPTDQGSKVSPQDTNKWVIMPKWECPILDFPKPTYPLTFGVFNNWPNNGPVSYNFTGSTMPNNHMPGFGGNAGFWGFQSANMWTHGMWHQYGVMPMESDGIYLYLADIDRDSMEYRLLGNPGTLVSAGDAQVHAVKKVPLYVLESSRSIESLATLVGFRAEEIMPPNQWIPSRAKKMGTLAEDNEKTISEAVLAMPFYYDSETGTTRAMTLRGDFSALGPKVKEFRRAFSNYSFPPALRKELKNLLPPDYPSVPGYVNPFGGDDYDEVLAPATARIPIVYLFEHTVGLSRQDLADMWQGIMPEIGNNFKTSVVAIDHYMPSFGTEESESVYPEVLRKQIELNIPRTGRPRADLLDTTTYPSKNGFTPEIRWMVFKVKQRGLPNYTTLIEQEINSGDATYSWNNKFGAIADNVPEGQRNALLRRKNKYTMSLYDNPNIGVGLNTYNWPYDYCSLVELGKLSSKVGFRPELQREEMPEDEQGLPPGPLSRNEEMEQLKSLRAERRVELEIAPEPTVSKQQDPQDVGVERVISLDEPRPREVISAGPVQQQQLPDQNVVQNVGDQMDRNKSKNIKLGGKPLLNKSKGGNNNNGNSGGY